MVEIMVKCSIGECLDKLTILDIKCDKIKDSRRDDCLKEYNVLYKTLKDFVSQFSYHYRILKEINLTIWNLQENIHNDMNLTRTYGQVLTENDRRFRVKKKINHIANSNLKEVKGYAKSKAYVLTHLGAGDHFWCNGAVRYISTCYDEVTVVVKKNNEALVRSMYYDDPTIIFQVIKDDNDLYNLPLKHYLEDEGYKVFTCGYHKENPRIYEFPHCFYDDMEISRSCRTEYFFVPTFDKAMNLYKSIGQSYILIHQNSSQKKINIFNPIQEKNSDMLILDINNNNYPENHKYYEKAQLVVNQPMLWYKVLIENAKEIHCLESSFYCFASHLDLSKVERKVCYEPFDSSAKRIGVFETGYLTH